MKKTVKRSKLGNYEDTKLRNDVTSQPRNFGPYANGDVHCKGWGDRIDMSVCITRAIRHPDKCHEAACWENL